MRKSVRNQHCLMDKSHLNVTNYDNTPLQYTANLMAVKGSFKSNLFCFVFHLTRVYLKRS